MVRKVAILGAGASGAFAAKACTDAGVETHMYYCDTGKVSPGAFWLHWVPIDIVPQVPAYPIYIRCWGDEEEYRRRQWGGLAHLTNSSFVSGITVEEGRDPSDVFPYLITSEVQRHITPKFLTEEEIKFMAKGFDLVLQTFPTKESLREQPALIPYIIIASDNAIHDPNVVTYNGSGIGLWVRDAVLFGNHFVEYPKYVTRDEIEDHRDLTGYKVITLRDIHPSTKPWQKEKDNIHLIGRFAEWNRKRLSHEVYGLVKDLLND